MARIITITSIKDMKTELTPLLVEDYSQLHQIMLDQGFPDVPDDFDEALSCLDATKIYGLFKNNQLKAGFIFGDITEQSAFVDAVCSLDFHGKWATLSVMRELYRIAFDELCLDFLWAQPKNKKSLRTALKAGFIYATSSKQKYPVVILTRRNIPKKFNRKGD